MKKNLFMTDRLYNRREIGYLLHLGETQIERMCNGKYKGRLHYWKNPDAPIQEIWYYEDHRKVEPVSGNGTKGHPYKYTLKSFREFMKGLQ